MDKGVQIAPFPTAKIVAALNAFLVLRVIILLTLTFARLALTLA